MQKYALLNNKLYTAVATPIDVCKSSPESLNSYWNEGTTEQKPVNDIRIRQPYNPLFPLGTNDTWNDTYTSSLVTSRLVVNCLNEDSNPEMLSDIIDAIEDLGLTEQFAINAAVRVEVRYNILDEHNQMVDEQTAKIKIGTIEDFVQPMGIDLSNEMRYRLCQAINARIEIAAPYRELGISKGSRGATRIIEILNVRVYISTTNENIYSQYLSLAQSKVGWPVNSLTQDQVRNYDVLIYDMMDDVSMSNQLPRRITIRSCKDRVDLNFTLFTNLFAYTLTTTDIDEALHMNQRLQSKYKIISQGDAHCKIAEPIIEDISYGETIQVDAEFDENYRALSIDIIGRYNEYSDIVLNYTTEGVEFPKEIFCEDIQIKLNENKLSIILPSVVDSYEIKVYSTLIPVETPPEEDPVDPDDTTGDTDGSDDTVGGDPGTTTPPTGDSGETDSGTDTPTTGGDGTTEVEPSEPEDTTGDSTENPDDSGDVTDTPTDTTDPGTGSTEGTENGTGEDDEDPEEDKGDVTDGTPSDTENP